MATMSTRDKPKSGKRQKSHARYLHAGYQPGRYDVLCGRGRRFFYHQGNEYFREMVNSMIPEYTKAISKRDKSLILSMIVQGIRAKAGIGGFVKQDCDGHWYEVGDQMAREKVSQAFRDALSHKYKSSSTYKKLRREVEQTGKLFDAHRDENSGTGGHMLPSAPVPFLAPQPQPPPIGQPIKTPTDPPFTTTSLCELLDHDLKQNFHRISGEWHVPFESLEPIPLPGPNPFALTRHQPSSVLLLPFQVQHPHGQARTTLGSNEAWVQET